MKVKATFDRIGRNVGPVPVEAEGDDEREIALDLWRFVMGRRGGKKWIGSQELEVHVDLDKETVQLIVGGFRSAGTGYVEVIEP